MSLEHFWKQPSDKMAGKKGNKNKKDTTPEVSEDGDLAEANPTSNVASTIGLDPALAHAFDLMTANITKVIDDKLSPLVETIHSHTAELQSASKRLDEAEARILAVENEVTPRGSRIDELEKQVAALTEDLDMAENYSRRLNIRVVGLPEGTETGQPVEFFETWLPSVLKMTTKGERVKLERAHRSLAPKPDSTKPPRSVLLRFHSFRDKQRAMEAARLASQSGAVMFNGSRLSFFSDFSSAVMRRRKAFDGVKQQLREKKIPYAMLFPAILQVSHEGSKKRFDTPERARDFVNSMT